MTNIFERATRMKLRFPYKGQISVEDLWDLPVQDLNKIYQELKRKEISKVDSLLETKSREDEILALKVQIVTHIFEQKQFEALEMEDAQKRKEKKQKLLEILEKKQNAEYENLSLEELQRMASDL